MTLVLTIGADPEVFVKEASSFVSGHTFPCGTKDNPRVVPHGAVQVDGLALEFNVRPSTTRSAFVSNTLSVLQDLGHIVKEINPEATLVAQPTVFFGEEYLKTLPEETTKLGCNPDYNAYTGQANPVPDASMPFRTGSGHIHIGFTEDETSDEHFDVCQTLVRELDYFVGLPSLLWDNDITRRKLYGQAGSFRPKSYGLEYRVLSNAWLAHEATIGFVYDQTIKAVNRMFNSKKKLLSEKYKDTAKTLIDIGDKNWVKGYQRIAHEVLHA